MSIIKYATIEQAKEIISNWNGKTESIKHLGNSGNSVFEYQTYNGQRQILRFTDNSFRTIEEVKGELEYLQHLEKKAILCNYPIFTKENEAIITFETDDCNFICSSLTYAEGEYITTNSIYWNKDFFTAWGRNLGQLHQASKSYQVQEYKTWEWNEENLFRDAEKLLLESDASIKKEFMSILKELSKYPKTVDNYGMIHADHAPQNFHYNKKTKAVTAFDFGNSCFHWYISDIAISFSTLRSLSQSAQDEVKKYLIKGYTEYVNLPKNHETKIELFIRLRNIYVYLSRLHWFGANPNQEQQRKLTEIRKRIL